MMQYSRKIFIIVVNYKNAELTLEMIRSLRKTTDYQKLSIVVVDNASGNGEYEFLCDNLPDCRVVLATDNKGFSAGNNIGIKIALDANADYILLLNNDTVVTPDFLTNMLRYANNKTIVSPQINYFSKPKKIWFAGGYIDRIRGGAYHYSDPNKCKSGQNITFASGCCMLIPVEFFRQCGLMNEDYFLYHEDTDLCLRALENNFLIR